MRRDWSMAAGESQPSSTNIRASWESVVGVLLVNVDVLSATN
jgi:hypothetical protein